MIIPAHKSHARQIAQIHFQELSGDFLPSLGCFFLEILYKSVIGKKNIWGFCYQDSLTNQIDGFIFGTKNIKIFFLTAIKSEGIRIVCILFFQVLKKPSLIKNILSTALYAKKESKPKAELIVICVRKESQGRGIGKKLVESLEYQFKKQKISGYKLTAHQDKPAVRFYEHSGFQKKSSFSLYGKSWWVFHRYFN